MNNTRLKLALIAWSIVAVALVAALGYAPYSHIPNRVLRLQQVQHSAPAFDQGQAAAVNDLMTGGTQPYSYQWLVETPSSLAYSTASQSICPSGSANGIYLPANSASLIETCTFQTNTATQTGLYSFMFNLTDSSTTPQHYTNVSSIIINAAPKVVLHAASGTIAAGGNDMLSARISAGTGPFTVNILYANGTLAYSAAASGGAVSYDFAPSSPGSYVFQADATDDGTASQFAFNSVPVQVNVSGPLTGGNVLIIESRSVMDVPQNVLLTARADSGVGPYIYSWSINGNSIGTNASTLTLYANASTLGSDSLSVKVEDAAGQNAIAYNTITVNSELNPSNVTIIVPQSTLYTLANETVYAKATGGTPPYTYSGWSLNYAHIAGTSNTAIIQGNGTDLGYDYLSVNVTDSAGEQATGSNVLNVSVRPDAYLTASPNAIDEGQNTVLTERINGTFLGAEGSPGADASATQGPASPYNVSFYDSASGSLIATVPAIANFSEFGINFIANAIYSPQHSGTIPINAVVTYAYGGSVYIVSYNSIMVYGALAVNATPKSIASTIGGSVEYSADVNGGSGNFLYQWYNYSGLSPSPITGQDSRNLTVPGSAQGAFTYLVKVTDIGVAPNVIAYSGNAMLHVSAPTTTAAPVLGSGGTGSPGGAGQKPTVKQVRSCYDVLNFTQDNQETLTLNGTSFNIVENFITPTSAGISVNGRSYTLSNGESIDAGSGSGYNYTLQLQNISYLPIQHVVAVSLCSSQTGAKAPNKNNPVNQSSHSGAGAPVNLSISSNGIITATGQSGQMIQIIANGNVVAQGTGTVVYNGYGLMPGIYSIVGRDNASSMRSGSQTFLRPKDVAVLELTGKCSNSTAAGPCTITGTIYTNGSVLNASLYLNGNYIGTTTSSINSTLLVPGNYVFALKTAGNAHYAPAAISYNYTVGGPQQAPALPAVVAIITAISSSVTVTALLRYHR